MNKSKIAFYILLLLLSVPSSLITTYFLGYWQHGRYWNGTIRSVNLFESAVYEKLLQQIIENQQPIADYVVFKDIFAPLDGKLLIRFIDHSGEVVFSNEVQDRSPVEVLRSSDFLTGADKVTVEFVRYSAPKWTKVYFAWLASPLEWINEKHDRIRMPFFFFLAIWFLVFVAALMRYRAKHLSRDVLGALDSLKKSS